MPRNISMRLSLHIELGVLPASNFPARVAHEEILPFDISISEFQEVYIQAVVLIERKIFSLDQCFYMGFISSEF